MFFQGRLYLILEFFQITFLFLRVSFLSLGIVVVRCQFPSEHFLTLPLGEFSYLQFHGYLEWKDRVREMQYLYLKLPFENLR